MTAARIELWCRDADGDHLTTYTRHSERDIADADLEQARRTLAEQTPDVIYSRIVLIPNPSKPPEAS